MSAAGISNIALPQPPTFNSLQHQRRVDWHHLADSLQSGDLAGAQQAYGDITALRQLSTRYRHFPNQQVGQDFAALGQALNSGDLPGAQQAFAKFQQDVQAARRLVGGGPRPGPTPDNAAAPDIIVNLSSGNGSSSSDASTPATTPSTGGNPASAGGSLPPITSTVGNRTPVPPITSTTAGSGSAGSGAEITLNLANHTGGNSEQITINFGHGSSNAHGQLTLNVSNGNNGSERITINFGGGQSQPESVQINLLA
jgi:hypothetical protein